MKGSFGQVTPWGICSPEKDLQDLDCYQHSSIWFLIDRFKIFGLRPFVLLGFICSPSANSRFIK